MHNTHSPNDDVHVMFLKGPECRVQIYPQPLTKNMRTLPLGKEPYVGENASIHDLLGIIAKGCWCKETFVSGEHSALHTFSQ